ncbi:sigma-70 family RNA polymerase sigma factor [Nocardia sp. 2]|uniref:Sigma-70 family RNA polymerase sigma factor n=1 Tax=Nocardia acididurans TaxID=2802282 RepID=A0ABS1M7E5_9NOCA|nr:sigma-70 family RNA polymerase sigma factor [Nocardia acididurans]MBL1075699.1 sigma-70 family RNA polymerase sigma factor [Nocardia acididurans]
MRPDQDPAETALGELLGTILRDCAHDPLLLIASTGSALVRVARTRASGAGDVFDEILVEAYESERDKLIGWAIIQVGDRADAEDIVQTALMRTYAARPEISDTAAMVGYLWTATRNLVRDRWRRNAADRGRVEPDGEEHITRLADRTGIPFDDLVTLRHLLIDALGQLPPREREAVVLHTYAGNTYAQTAELMGLAAGTVKAYVAGALAKVRANLQAA